MFMTEQEQTKEIFTAEIKTWRGLRILEHFKIDENGNEIDLLDTCDPWMKNELKVLRS